jgi:hypothetical protein
VRKDNLRGCAGGSEDEVGGVTQRDERWPLIERKLIVGGGSSYR